MAHVPKGTHDTKDAVPGAPPAPGVSIVSLSGGTSDSPTLIADPGSSIVLAALLTVTPDNNYFTLDPSFGVGDAVELYYDPNAPVLAAMVIWDENGNDVSPDFSQSYNRGYYIRKIASGTGFNWVRRC